MGPGAGTAMLGRTGLGFANVVRADTDPQPGVGVVAAAGAGAGGGGTPGPGRGPGDGHHRRGPGRDLSEAVGGRMARSAGAAGRPRTPTPCSSSRSRHRSRCAPHGSRRSGRRAARWRRFSASPTPRRTASPSLPPSKSGASRLLAASSCAARPRRLKAAVTDAVATLPNENWYGASPAARSARLWWCCSRNPRAGVLQHADPRSADHSDGVHVCLDLGCAKGRPHPMIDPEARLEHLQVEGARPDVAVVLLDVVLGYGAHDNPSHPRPRLRRRRRRRRTGTDDTNPRASLPAGHAGRGRLHGPRRRRARRSRRRRSRRPVPTWSRSRSRDSARSSDSWSCSSTPAGGRARAHPRSARRCWPKASTPGSSPWQSAQALPPDGVAAHDRRPRRRRDAGGAGLRRRRRPRGRVRPVPPGPWSSTPRTASPPGLCAVRDGHRSPARPARRRRAHRPPYRRLHHPGLHRVPAPRDPGPGPRPGGGPALAQAADRPLRSFDAVVPNGVDAARFRTGDDCEQASVRPRAGGDEAGCPVLTVGGIEPRKGRSPARGDGRSGGRDRRQRASPGPSRHRRTHVPGLPHLHAALDRASGLGLVEGSDFHLLGTVTDDELAAWYHAADAFAFPSVKEGCGLAVLEALAAGLPVVTTDIEVSRSTWRTTRARCSVPPATPRRWPEAPRPPCKPPRSSPAPSSGGRRPPAGRTLHLGRERIRPPGHLRRRLGCGGGRVSRS